MRAKQNLTILHTNDMHSHLQGFHSDNYATKDGPYLKGGIARISTKIKEIRKEKEPQSEPVLLLDSGDFMVGTLYELLTRRFSPEFTLMDILKYDAVTLGNHEFEYSSRGLAKAIRVARTNIRGSTVPIVTSNIQLNFSGHTDGLRGLCEEGVIKPYLVKTLPNGIKVGIIGLLGENAEEVAFSKGPIGVNHNKSFIQGIVDVVKNKGCHLIICLSHSGIAEDKELAHLIEGIDVIISGHDHKALSEPIKIKDTFIVEAGAYTKYLGELTLFINNGKLSLRRYQLIPINEDIEEDIAVQRTVDEYTDLLDSKILNPIGLSFAKPIARTGFDLTKPSYGESNLGDLVADAMRTEIDLYQSEHLADFVFEATGFIGEDILGDDERIITVSDVFQLLPLGIGPDEECGYPLVSFYLNAQEIKHILEASVLLSSLGGRDYLLQVSGLRFWCHPQGEIFKKVRRMEKWDFISQRYIPIDISDGTILYKVGCNLQIAKFISQAIILKDFRGKPINIFTDVGKEKILVDANPHVNGVQELKQWRAFVHYLSSLPDLNGDSIPDIPDKYAIPQGRINLI
ncbi:MAG: bifunctional UDP-sugar hydrolase/5'-nucleotidase [Candidatus Aerophobetes bacterium]|nr:bifunctional UDP-sugar hydrolase/5'-nucleotidase [Candidatus Aerophobetes bacterium]